jgi:cytoskeletal protein RodZ
VTTSSTSGREPVGASLRLAREQAGLSLRQISDETRISIRNLQALEDDRVDQLPGGILRRGIVRAHARSVGLNPDDVLASFLARYPDDVPTWDDLVPAARMSTARQSLRVCVRILGAMIPLCAGAYFFAGASARSAANASPISARATMGATSTMSSTVANAKPTSADDGLPMMVSVSAPTLLQIVVDGREVEMRRFEAGEIARVKLGNDAVLLADNAGAVHLSINGRAGKTLGSAGVPLAAHISRVDYDAWLMQP